jgi:hypothetical protein
MREPPIRSAAANLLRQDIALVADNQEDDMRLHLVAMLCAAAIGFAASFPAYAQPKTIKACEDEWQAKKAENQKAGITEKAYVDKCRAESAVPPAAATKAPPAKEPVPAPTATKAPPAKEPAPTATKAPAPTAKAPTAANEFSTEAAAKARCPTDTIVWLNTSSKIFHFASSKDYGKTKSGAYMCEKESLAAGNRAAKNEKQP